MNKKMYTRTEVINKVTEQGVHMTAGSFEDYQKRGLIPKAMRIKGEGSRRLYEEYVIEKILKIKKSIKNNIRLKDIGRRDYE